MIGGLSASRANVKSVLVLRDYPVNMLRGDGQGPKLPKVIFAFDLSTADGLFSARSFAINPQDTVYATEASLNSARTILGTIGSLAGVSNSVNTSVSNLTK